MTTTQSPQTSTHPLEDFVDRLLQGEALLPDNPDNLVEVVGILHSYGVVLDAYAINLVYMAEHQFLVLFPFFKYFNGEITLAKLLRHWWHDRINYEYAEYCMRTMLWHTAGGGLEAYLDTDDFRQHCETAIQAKVKSNPLIGGLHRLFPDFLPEQVRMLAYTTALGQFWRVMSDLFMDLSRRYDEGEIDSIPAVVEHIKAGLVSAAATPITYSVKIGAETYDILPASANLTFLVDVALPYVECIFLRGTPFLGVVSYNAQAQQIPGTQSGFTYGALFADPLPTGGAGIPPTLLMQDMRHFVPEYLHHFYRKAPRGEDDIRVQICQSFQKSMYCVTTATILGLMPHAADTSDSAEQAANRKHLIAWLDRLMGSRLPVVQLPSQPIT
jgi:CO2 hydration protein